MSLDKFNLVPQSPGYTVASPQDAVLRQQLDSGRGRYRANIEGGSYFVTTTYMTDDYGWQYAEAFFRSRTYNGAEPFLADLVVAGSGVSEFTVYVMPGSWQLTQAEGPIRVISVQYEVLPRDEDPLADSSLVDIWEASNGDPAGYLNGFAPIIIAWPEA